MSIRVVVADSQRLVRMGLMRLLDDAADIQVVGEADNGLDALERVQTLSPDVLLTAIGLPLLNGIEVTRRVRSEHPEVRVVVLTIHTDERSVLEMFRAGANAYLTKNAGVEELLGAIRRVHSGQTYLSPVATDTVLKHFLDKSEGIADSPDYVLSVREREVIQLIAEGKSSKDIATLLHVSLNTVIRHRQNIGSKLGLSGVAELTRYALREGIASLE